MKVTIELENDETITDSEEFLAKALKVKAECDHGERYTTNALNELHNTLCSEFSAALSDSMLHTEEILRDATGTKNG